MIKIIILIKEKPVSQNSLTIDTASNPTFAVGPSIENPDQVPCETKEIGERRTSPPNKMDQRIATNTEPPYPTKAKKAENLA